MPVSPRRWCCYQNSTACSALCSAAFVRLDYLIEASEILCDGMAEDFVKSMKAGGLGGPGEAPALLHVRERSGIMACRGVVLAGVDHA